MSEPAALAGSEGYEVCSNDVAGMAGLEPAMRESKSLALPLGYTPISKGESRSRSSGPSASKCGVGKGTRTLDTRNHNPVL